MKIYPSPFPKGIKCEEAPDDSPEYSIFSHKRFASTREAKDLPAEIGTPVLAIESGVVALVKNDSDRYINPQTHPRYKILFIEKNIDSEELKRLDGELLEFAGKYTNYVQINQVDGSIAEYLHLDKNVQVDVKQKIMRGDKIGFVGMTGITTGPHLHLNIFESLSIPFELRER